MEGIILSFTQLMANLSCGKKMDYWHILIQTLDLQAWNFKENRKVLHMVNVAIF